MKRIAVFEDTKCPYARLEEKVGYHKDENGKLIFDRKQTIYCDKNGYTISRTCCEENCPLPPMPKRIPEELPESKSMDALSIFEFGVSVGNNVVIDMIGDD